MTSAGIYLLLWGACAGAFALGALIFGALYSLFNGED